MDKKTDVTITITSSDPELNYRLVSAVRNALPGLCANLKVQVEELAEAIKVFSSLEEAEALLNINHSGAGYEDHRGDYVVIDGHYTLEQVSALSYLASAGVKPLFDIPYDHSVMERVVDEYNKDNDLKGISVLGGEPIAEVPSKKPLEPLVLSNNSRILSIGQSILEETLKRLETSEIPHVRTLSWIVDRELDGVSMIIEYSPRTSYLMRFHTGETGLLMRLLGPDMGFSLIPRIHGDVGQAIKTLSHFKDNWTKGGTLVFTPVPGICTPAEFDGKSSRVEFDCE